MTVEKDKRWWALYVLCAGELMIVVDTTVVNVALPSIRESLAFSEASLVWVVNAYMLTYGGFLLLGGRLGDYFGHRRLFLLGIALFTAASLVCGLSNSQWLLIAARAVQGLGGAVVSAIALSLIIDLFTEDGERAKAMGVYGFVCAAGGSLGVLAGGLLTSALSWHWVFLVNIPIGIAVYVLCRTLIGQTPGKAEGKLDYAGAATVTASSTLAVYGIVNGNLPLLAAAAVLLAVFLLIQSRVSTPLMPLRFFRVRSLTVSSIVGALWAASMFAWFFISALYMQESLGYTPMQIGLAFLPSNLIMAAFSLGLSAKIVMRYGNRLPLAVGLGLAAVGLALFAAAPTQGSSFVLHILPCMVLLGIGCGMALNPILLVAMGEVAPTDSGLASGVVNTAFMMGGALGLAVLASFAEGSGYRAAFILATLFAVLAAVLSWALLRNDYPTERKQAWASQSSTSK
ncbi:MAG TPA: MFS transporter [Burkholderiales bacterium]